MVGFVNELPEIRASRSGSELEDLGPLPKVTEEVKVDEQGNTTGYAEDLGSRFTVHSAVDFGAGPPMAWVVRGVLPRAELAVVFGESGSGKSFLALDLCAAVTRGIEWRGKRVARGRVVYVCAEGAGGFKARLKAYAYGHNVELAELPAVISDAPNLLEPKEAAAITKAILDWGQVDVIVIDTLSATTPGGNENSGEDMGLVLSHCKFLHRKTGALVVLIHHSGKDATRGARGWSGLRAAADAEIEITRNGDYRTAAISKMKDGSDGAAFSFKLKVVPLGENDEGEEESSCVVEHIESAPVEASKHQRVGPREAIVLDLLKVMAPSGTVAQEDLIEGYKAKVPKPDGRDQRRAHATVALTSLVSKKLAFMHGEDRVSLTSLVTNATWLDT
jgi:hypothetical protein